MKKSYFYLVSVLAGIALLAATQPFNRSPLGLSKGKPDIKSVSALTFGKDGVLFKGDSKSATIFAVETKFLR